MSWYRLYHSTKRASPTSSVVGRLEPEIAPRGFDVGRGLRDVSRLQRQQLLHRRAAPQPFEHSDEVEELLRAVIAEIVDAVAQAGRRQPVKMAVSVRDQLAAAFCGGLERNRLIDPVLDTERLLLVGAIDRR